MGSTGQPCGSRSLSLSVTEGGNRAMPQPKILIVDDEILIARELEARLCAFGYGTAGVAPSGEDAIRLASEAHPDVVLMDIVLKGGMDGIAAAGEIRKRFDI